MGNTNLKAALEAILFAIGETISLQELSEALGVSLSNIRELLVELQNTYENENRGIQLIHVNAKVQLCTRPEYHQYIDCLMKGRNNAGLSQASLETLSIIAYKQPVTRVEIENLRGVKSSSSIQTLIDRSLIREAGRLDAPGKPILYETTLEFLKYAGIPTIKQLPDYQDFVTSVQKQKNDEEVAIHIDC